MSWDISQFHFIRPVYLLALPVLLGLWWLTKNRLRNNQWQNVIPKEMLSALRVGNSGGATHWRWLLLSAWVVATLAMAGPTWTKTALPTVQNQKAVVIVLDLSPSMLAKDLTPDRLTRSKYKLIDILRKQTDGQIALIAYAGDAHAVSPLTDDPKTIEALLPALHPSIMPSQGSNTEAAIALAVQLLNGAQAGKGDILLISDGVTKDAQQRIKKSLKPQIRLSILGVGGVDPTPIPATNGGFLKDSEGQIILSSLNTQELQQLASSTSGRFIQMRTDDADIEYLLDDDFEGNTETTESESVFYDSWEDMGHWLVLLILPLAAFCFRKGVIYLLPVFFIVPINHSEAQTGNATPTEASQTGSFWRNLWRTPDQQGIELLEQKKYSEAADTFTRSDWVGAANYKSGNYQQAFEQFSKQDDTTNLYNKGNALAFSGELEAAIEAYDQVIEQQADHADALHNKKVVEQLLQQQLQNQQGSNENSDQDNQESDSNEQQQNQEPSENSDEQNDTENSEPSQDQQPQDQQAQNQQSDGEQAEDKESEQQQSREPEPSEQNPSENQSEPDQANQVQQSQQSEEPLKDSSEQWLRKIEDDPSGLMRRKFEYQAWQRAREQQNSENTSNLRESETRY